MSLRARIFFLFLIISISGILSISIIFFTNARSEIINQVYSKLEAVSETKKNRIEGIISKRQEQIALIEGREYLLSRIANFIASANEQDRAYVTSSFDAIKNTIPTFKEVHLADLSGNIILSTDPKVIGKAVSQTDYFRHALSGETCLHDFAYMQDTLIIHLATLCKMDEKKVAVMIIETDANDLQSLINDYTGLGETGETVLAELENKQAKFLTPTRFYKKKQPLYVDVSKGFSVVAAVKGKQGLHTDLLDYRNVEVISSAKSIPQMNWGLSTKMDLKEVNKPVMAMAGKVFFMSLLLIVLVIYISYRFSNYILEPIDLMAKTTAEITGGDYSKRVEYAKKNELGTLATSFNTMTDRFLSIQAQLEKSNESLKEFSYKVSHDLKSPLNTVEGLVNLILAKQEKLTKNELISFVEMIQKSNMAMNELVKEILNYSIAGLENTEKEKVDLNQVVNYVVSITAIPEHVTLSVNGKLPEVWASKVALMQIFQNIISNAVKYMDKAEGFIEIGSIDKRSKYEIYVKDNGRGIEKRDHKKIFEFRNKVNQDSSVDSSGVGLSIVKKLIVNQGGDIWIESETGLGSAFYFTIPKLF